MQIFKMVDVWGSNSKPLSVQVQKHIRLFRTLNKRKECKMTICNEWALNISYRPQNLTKEASYRYEILIRYKRLREKEALEFLQVKRSTYFNWLKRKKEIVIPENSQTCTLCLSTNIIVKGCTKALIT